jgi:hypothetical protein
VVQPLTHVRDVVLQDGAVIGHSLEALQPQVADAATHTGFGPPQRVPFVVEHSRHVPANAPVV